MADPNSIFEKSENALCWHRNAIYECKVVEVLDSDKPRKYKVHYKGWSDKWDEIVEANRLMKDNDASRRLMDNMKISAKKKAAAASAAASSAAASAAALSAAGSSSSGAASASSSASASASGASATANSSKRKRKRGDDVDTSAHDRDGPNSASAQIRIVLPLLLEQHLIYDYEQIVIKRKLIPLPRSPNVLNILNDFYNLKTKGKGPAGDTQEYWIDIVNGLKHYFDDAAPRLLLYEEERKTMKSIQSANPDVKPSQLLGAEHLVRLFTKLPLLLSHAALDDQAARLLEDRLDNFLQFLAGNLGHYFTVDYAPTQ